jgi:hypothetical protein
MGEVDRDNQQINRFHKGANMADEHDKDKTVTIYVNTKAKEWPKNTDISFTQVVGLSGLPTGPGITYLVDYHKGENPNKGTLVEGQSVKVKAGMIFDVTKSDKS